MNALLLWMMSPEWAHIVSALLHSLWQAGAIALLLALALRRFSSPAWRYRLTLGSLGGVLLTTLLTWAVLNQRSRSHIGPPVMSAQAMVASFPPEHRTEVSEALIFKLKPEQQKHTEDERANWIAWMALLWSLGAMLMLARAGIQLAGAERLRRSGKPLADAGISQLLAETQRAIGLARVVRVAITDTLTSPAVVGVLVPTLILPLSLITTLTHEQLRFVLLHELAHIQRGDYFANLFQLLVEALLFFNPAVWWISHQVRREREACCDALAIELSGAPVDYARTLLQVAESALSPSPAAAPAFGDKQHEPSSLSDRVQRLLVPGYRPALRLTWRAMLVSFMAGGTLLVLSALGARNTIGVMLASETESTARKADLQKSKTATLSPSKAAQDTGETATPVANASYTTQSAASLAVNGREVISNKLNQIYLDHVHFESTPFTEVIRVLTQAAKKQDPQGRGINFVFNSGTLPEQVADQPPLDRHRILEAELTIRQKELADLRARFTDEHQRVIQLNMEISRLTRVKTSLEPILITITPPLTNVSVADLLTIIVANASQPIYCSIQGFGVLFTLGTSTENLLTRRIKVNPTTLYRWLDPPNYVDAPPSTNRGVGVQRITALPDSSLDRTTHPLHKLFAEAGIDMQPPKTFFYKDRIGELFIRATPEEIQRLTRLLAETDTELARGFPANLFASSAANESSSSLKSAELSELTDKVPVLSDLPIVGKLLRSSSNEQSGAVEENSQLYSRRFKIDPNTFTKNLAGITVHQPNLTYVAAIVRDFLASFGVELTPPKNVYFNDRAGELLVRATLQDLDVIEEALQVLNAPTPQVNIKVRFVEVDSQNGFDWSIGNMLLAATNSATGSFASQFSGILTEPQYRVVLRAMEERKSAKVLAMQEITTFSGQPAQIQTVELRTVVNGMNLPLPGLPNHVSTNLATNPNYQTQVLPFGAVLDVTPYVAADGHTIQMTLLPTVTEFLGYDDPGKFLIGSWKPKRETQLPLPRTRLRQVSLSANVWDGQTLFLGTASEEILSKKPDGSIDRTSSRDAKKQLLIFITPTIIDQGGNRMSDGNQLPTERSNLPPTPKK